MSKTKRDTTKLCTICGKPIPAIRLEALPGATTCIHCARKNPPKIDPGKFDLSQASPIDRTGFAPTD